MNSTNPETPKATSREWFGLAVLALPCLLYSMDLTVLNLAVPKLSAALRPTNTELLWIVDIYGFVLAGALIPMGVLGDRIGRRRLLLIGAAAFGCASVLAAFAPSVEALIAARALLGLAAATLAPSTLSLLRSMFLDPKQRTFAVGVWIASFSAGGAIGPLIGGVLLQFFWWGSVFLINLPVMLLLLAVGPRLLPEFRDPQAGRPDIFSAALCMTTVLSVIYGIKRIAGHGADWVAAATIVSGLVIGAAFLRRQWKLAEPFIDLGLFRRVTFSAALAVNLFGFFVAFGTFLLVAQYFQLVIGLSPLAAGLWSAPSGIAFVVGAMLTPRIVTHLRPPHVIAVGFVIAAVGFGLLTQTGTRHDLAVVATAYTVFSLGLAPVFTLASDLIVSTAPPERAGAAAGMSEMSAELGGALGIALLGSVVTFIYRGAIATTLDGDLPSNALETARATLGGALSVAGTLPDELGAALVTASRSAFVEAFQTTALASAAIALVAAAGTVRVLGRPQQKPDIPSASDAAES
ncbi:MAG TPA: MFS transporter [Burkholderiales bacterium]|jgi:DHA2 family multidrug resistance protein-like MFS transporter|nr:MFS transporter [Burkholderiales bacterium]